MNSTNQYHIDGIFVALCGASKLIFPWAFLPHKGVSKNEFVSKVIVEELVRLTKGVNVHHRGERHSLVDAARRFEHCCRCSE